MFDIPTYSDDKNHGKTSEKRGKYRSSSRPFCSYFRRPKCFRLKPNFYATRTKTTSREREILLFRGLCLTGCGIRMNDRSPMIQLVGQRIRYFSTAHKFFPNREFFCCIESRKSFLSQLGRTIRAKSKHIPRSDNRWIQETVVSFKLPLFIYTRHE